MSVSLFDSIHSLLHPPPCKCLYCSATNQYWKHLCSPLYHQRSQPILKSKLNNPSLPRNTLLFYVFMMLLFFLRNNSTSFLFSLLHLYDFSRQSNFISDSLILYDLYHRFKGKCVFVFKHKVISHDFFCIFSVWVTFCASTFTMNNRLECVFCSYYCLRRPLATILVCSSEGKNKEKHFG